MSEAAEFCGATWNHYMTLEAFISSKVTVLFDLVQELVDFQIHTSDVRDAL